MRVSLMAFALAALVSGARAENHDLTTAILVQPIHDAQVVHADDGKDHVDYELLVVNAFAAPFTLSSVIVLDPSEKELGRRVTRSPQRRRPSSLKRQARAYPPQRRRRSTSIWRFRPAPRPTASPTGSSMRSSPMRRSHRSSVRSASAVPRFR